MANLYYDVRLDIQKDNVLDSGLRFTQGDSKVIYLRIAVMNGGTKFDASGTTPAINFVKPDGTIVVGTPAETETGWIYQFLGNELQAPGKVLCDMKFTYESGRVSSSKFTFIVEKDTAGIDATVSASYIAPMDALYNEMKGYKDLGYSMAQAAEIAADEAKAAAAEAREFTPESYSELVETVEGIVPKVINLTENGQIDADNVLYNEKSLSGEISKLINATSKINEDGTINGTDVKIGDETATSKIEAANEKIDQANSDIEQINETLSESADWLKSKNRINNIERGGLISGLTPAVDDNRLRTGYIGVEPNKSFTISNSISGFRVAVSGFEVADNVTERIYSSGWQSLPFTFEADGNTNFVKLLFSKSDDSDIYVSDIGDVQLEEGTVATPYQPYSESNVELTAKLSQNEKDGFLINNIVGIISQGDGDSAVSNRCITDYIPYDSNKPFITELPPNVQVLIFKHDASKNYLGNIDWSNSKSYSPTEMGSTTKYVLLLFRYSNNSAITPNDLSSVIVRNVLSNEQITEELIKVKEYNISGLAITELENGCYYKELDLSNEIPSGNEILYATWKNNWTAGIFFTPYSANRLLVNSVKSITLNSTAGSRVIRVFYKKK